MTPLPRRRPPVYPARFDLTIPDSQPGPEGRRSRLVGSMCNPERESLPLRLVVTFLVRVRATGHRGHSQSAAGAGASDAAALAASRASPRSASRESMAMRPPPSATAATGTGSLVRRTALVAASMTADHRRRHRSRERHSGALPGFIDVGDDRENPESWLVQKPANREYPPARWANAWRGLVPDRRGQHPRPA